MEITNVNHICFSVSDLNTSIQFYKDILHGDLLVSDRTTAYLTIGHTWIALNQEKNIPRNEISHSYTHIAFSIDEEDFQQWIQWLKENQVNILKGRPRDIKDKKSIYFTDPDGHKIELHTGTLKDRMEYYKSEKTHMQFYGEF